MQRRVVQSIYKTGNGEWLDGSIYYEHKNNPRSRNAKFRPSSEAQQRLNEDNARRKLTRLLQDNFRPFADFIVHPTYDINHYPSDSEKVAKDLRNFLLRIKRIEKRLGVIASNAEFKYVSTPIGDKHIRKHMHLVITGCKDREVNAKLRAAIEELWPFGTCNVDRVQPDGENGLAGIAGYICENHQMAKDIGEHIFTKRWSCSKNLERPEPSERRGALPVSLLPKIAAATPAERIAIIEEKFPGYKAVEVDVAELKDAPEERKHRIYGNYYIYIRMRKANIEQQRR